MYNKSLKMYKYKQNGKLKISTEIVSDLCFYQHFISFYFSFIYLCLYCEMIARSGLCVCEYVCVCILFKFCLHF